MSKIVVDLDAYVIDNSHKVFKCSPGKTYRFYREVRRTKTVFLDIRGLDALPEDTALWKDADILKLIADDRWSRELESREKGNEPVGTEGVGRADRTRLGFLKGLLFEAKKGDLIVVPVDGYNKDVLIGEVLDDAGDVRRIEATDDEDTFTYLGRRVEWRAAMPKRFLDEDLIKAIHTQTAFFLLGRSLYEGIYRLAFGNFIFDGQFVSEFKTTKERFTAEDHAVVSTWINGLDVLYNSPEFQASAPSSKNLPSFFELGLKKLDDDISAEVKIDIQSPGEIFVKTAGPFALALMAMFALSGCDSKAVIDNGVTVKLKTVGSADGGGNAVSDCVNAMAIALGQSRLDQQCSLGKRAHEDAKLTTAATLKSSGKGSK